MSPPQQVRSTLPTSLATARMAQRTAIASASHTPRSGEGRGTMRDVAMASKLSTPLSSFFVFPISQVRAL